jgi:hypothetical protein
MPRGGYQKPSNPAPVSGPGALSKRTDGGPGAMQGAKYVSGLPYGQGQEFQDVQQMAPMEAATPTPSATSVGAAPAQLQAMQPPVPLTAPTQRPNEPVTTGIDHGPGAGSEVMPRAQQFQNPYSLSSSLQPLLEHDTTGDIAMLYKMAVNNGW